MAEESRKAIQRRLRRLRHDKCEGTGGDESAGSCAGEGCGCDEGKSTEYPSYVSGDVGKECNVQKGKEHLPQDKRVQDRRDGGTIEYASDF